MIGKPSLRTTYIATLLFGFTLGGWFGAAPAANATDELLGSELSGYVFADLDIDNVRDPFEVGIADVEIVLTMLSDPDFSLTMLSNQSGYYQFTGLDAGIYSITQPIFPLGVRNTCVRAGDLHDIVTGDPLSSDAGTAFLLDQSLGILPHVEGIELPDGARGTGYNFGQVYLGKAWLITDPIPIIPTPEPSTSLLLAFGGLLLGTVRRRGGRR